MQDELAEEFRSPRKRLVRTSSLDDLREQKRLTRTESKEIGCDARDHQLDDAFNGWLKEAVLHNGHEKLETRENQSLREHGEAMGIMSHRRRDTASTATEVEVHQLGSPFDAVVVEVEQVPLVSVPVANCASLVEDVLASERPYQVLLDEDLQKTLFGVPPLLDSPHKQGFPSPHAVEMVPVSSTKLTHSTSKSSVSSTKKTKTRDSISKKRECQVHVRSSGSSQKKPPERISRERIESTTYGVMPEVVPEITHAGYLLYPDLMRWNCAHGWHQMISSNDAEPVGTSKAVFRQSSASKDPSCPVHMGSRTYRPVPRHVCHSMTSLPRTNANAVNQGTPFLLPKLEHGGACATEKHKTVKKATSAGSRDAEADFHARRLCQKHKRTKKDKVSSDKTGTDCSLHARHLCVSSGDGSGSKSVSSPKKEHSSSSRGNTKQDPNRRTTFAHLVHAKLVRTGKLKLAVGHEPNVVVTVNPEGSISYKGVEYNSISSFALAVIRERNPGRRSCDGWKDVKYEGQRLETLRERYLNGSLES